MNSEIKKPRPNTNPGRILAFLEKRFPEWTSLEEIVANVPLTGQWENTSVMARSRVANALRGLRHLGYCIELGRYKRNKQIKAVRLKRRL